MAKTGTIEVSLDVSQLDALSKQSIKDLEKKLKNAEKREETLKRKVNTLESERQEAKEIIDAFENFIEAVRFTKPIEDLIDSNQYC